MLIGRRLRKYIELRENWDAWLQALDEFIISRDEGGGVVLAHHGGSLISTTALFRFHALHVLVQYQVNNSIIIWNVVNILLRRTI